MQLQFEASVYCEMNPAKQEPNVLVSDTKELDGDMAKNVARTGNAELLPPCFLMDVGYPCTSRTPLSSKCQNSVNCVQEER